MEYVTLANSDLKVSRLCVGGCPMGGYGWGEVQKDELIAAVRRALDLGVNFFDTADTYGLGQSEMTLAEGLGNRRKEAIIQTKFGVIADNGVTYYDNSPDYIEHALNASLSRLKTDYIDVLTIHYRDGLTPIAEVVEKLQSLKKQGKIRYFGLSNIHDSDIREILPFKNQFVACQEEYSLACRKNEGDLLMAQKILGITPLSWGSLGQGVLTGKYNKENAVFGSNDRRSRAIYVNFHGEKFEKNLQIVDVLKEIAANHNKSVSACAIRFIFDYLQDSVVLTGVKRPSQIESNAEAMGWNLNEEEISLLNKVSL